MTTLAVTYDDKELARLSDRAEGSLTELSERNDVIKTVIRRTPARWANVWVENYKCSNIAIFSVIWRKGWDFVIR
jgi:hypothetical protein